jgi:uncharacterized lipoprotein YajG
MATRALRKEQRQRQEQAAAQAKRRRQLENLAPRPPKPGDRIHKLIALRQAKPYDEAVALLKDLHDLAELQGCLTPVQTATANLKIRLRQSAPPCSAACTLKNSRDRRPAAM